MPKITAAALVWSGNGQLYEIREVGNANGLRWSSELGAVWLEWLSKQTSFAFQGQQGHLTLQKETRTRGDSYWYAYRYLAGRTTKKYVGRSANITPNRLESLAASLASTQFADSTENLALPATPQPSSQVAQNLFANLLVPKLRLPRPHHNLIARPLLLEQLDNSLNCKLTVVAAPAGFGKTSLLGNWVAARTTKLPPVAWIALDSGDNDPGRFWTYFIAACQTFRPNLGLSALPLIRAAQQPHHRTTPLEAGLTSLLNELTDLPERGGILVLEDYHLITRPEIHQGLNYLLEHLPPGLRLIMLVRSEPPLALARLRARGELLELGSNQLRFSLEETQAFLQQAFPQQEFTSSTLEQLHGRTEGWATGLRLLTLASQNQEQTGEQKQSNQLEDRLTNLLSGKHRHILDYLVADVLSAQPEHLQLFLLQTTGLTRLNSSLCEAVTGHPESLALLEQIEQRNLFLLPLDNVGQWYRYHALFAEAIQHEARRRLGEATLRQLARRACQWYEQHGMQADAIEVVMGAAEFDQAAQLINQLVSSPNLSYLSEFHTLLRWVGQLPFEILQKYPLLCQVYAMLLLFNADNLSSALYRQIELYLQIAAAGWQTTNNATRLGELLALRALIAGQVSDFGTALGYAKQGLALLAPDERSWRSTAMTYLGIEQIMLGNFAEAHRIVQEARVLMESTGNLYGLRPILSLLANIYGEQGKLQQATTLYQEVLTSAEGDQYDKAFALSGLAALAYERNDLALAEQYAQETILLNQSPRQDLLQIQATLVLAQVRVAQANFEAAEELLRQLLVTISHPHWQRELETWLVWLTFAAQDIPAAQQQFQQLVSSRVDTTCPEVQQEREAMLEARLLLRQGQVYPAIVLLKGWLTRANQQQRFRQAAKITLLLAQACFQQRNLPEAKRLAQEVLATGRAGNYRRLFLDENSAELLALLKATLPDLREKPLAAYTKNLIGLLENSGVVLPATSEPLSNQEKRVFALLVAGRTNPEIARELVVSVNTIKAQIKSIYRKLDVNNRFEVGQRVRELNL